MLFLFFGPSGGGKTSLLERLSEDYGWKLITSYITRPARPNEKFKTSLSEEDYKSRYAQGMFFSHVEQLGYKYGTLKGDIELAVGDKALWGLDFAVEQYSIMFSDTPNHALIVLPQDSDQLIHQLTAANREDRIPKATADLEEKFSDTGLARFGLEASKRVLNPPNQLANLAKQINSMALEILRHT